VSKVLERLVLAHLWLHLLTSANFSQFQSTHRKGHSTETALQEVLDGVFTAADDKQVTVIGHFQYLCSHFRFWNFISGLASETLNGMPTMLSH